MRCRRTITCASLVSLLLLSCSPRDSDRSAVPPATPSTPTASNPAGELPARSLLYLDGRDLRSFELKTGRDRLLGRAPSTDAEVSPDGTHVAYVVASSPTPGDEDFIASPELRVVEVTTGKSSTVGPGFSPLWSPDGTLLAALVPADDRNCEGETCLGTVAAAVFDPDSGERTAVAGPGQMSLLGWWGERLLVGLQDPPAAVAASVDGSVERLGLVPNEVWGPAPDGGSIFVINGDSAHFEVPESSDEAEAVPLEGLVLGEGAWAPDSETVAAVGLRARGSELVLVEPQMPGLQPVPDSEGAQGQVVWAPDSASFVFTRSIGGRDLRLEAVHCTRSEGIDCERLFSWGRGVRLLGLIH